MAGVCEQYDVQVDREIRTRDRFMGKQVYVKLIDFGALPAGGEKNVPHGLTDIDQIGVDYSRSWVQQSNGNRYDLTLPNTGANSFWRVRFTSTDLGIQVGKDRSAFTAMICVWFTRKSEAVGQCDGCAEDAIAALQTAQDALSADLEAARTTADQALVLARNAVPRAGQTNNSHYEQNGEISVSSLILDQSSPNLINLAVAGALSVTAQALEADKAKIVTLNARATADTDLTWPEAVIWKNDPVTSVYAGGRLTVRMLFSGGLILGKVLHFADGEPAKPEPGEGTTHFLVTSFTGEVAYGPDPSRFRLGPSSLEQRFSFRGYRESDGMFYFAVADQSGRILYGQNPESLTLRQLGSKTLGDGLCRQSDGMFLASDWDKKVYYGTDPGQMNSFTVGNKDQWNTPHFVCRESDGLLVMLGSKSPIAYGANPTALRYTQLGDYTYGGICNPVTGEFILFGSQCIFVGTDPENLEKIQTPFCAVRNLAYRESDGLYWGTTIGIKGNSQTNYLIYGTDIRNLSSRTCTPAVDRATVRQSDGTLLVIDQSSSALFHGQSPTDLQRTQLDAQGIYDAAFRQSDGMLLVGGKQGKLWYGHNPAQLTATVIGDTDIWQVIPYRPVA